MIVNLTTINLLWPEIILVVMATWIILVGAFKPNRTAWSVVALASYLAAGAALLFQLAVRDWELWKLLQAGGLRLSGPLTVDFLAAATKVLALSLGLLFTLLMAQRARKELASEFIGVLMLAIAGLMFVASAGELVLLFLGLELITIPTYVLLFLGRRDRGSAEATVKYFFLSILSTAMLLYGFSFLYGLAGTTSLSEIASTISNGDQAPSRLLMAVAIVFIFAGLGFKIAAVPFHFYAPDVYQGTTNSNAGLLAVVPKIAGIVAIVRLMVIVAPLTSDFAWHVAIILSVVTMTVGNVCALWQRNLRRLMAYSSIAHAGYLLIGISTGLAASDSGGISATLFYLLVYSFATLGTFATLALLEGKRSDVTSLDDLAGLAKNHPAPAAALAVFMFSLAGIPPLAGFWGKLSLFGSALELATDPNSTVGFAFAALAILGAINAAIAAAYYLRVIAVMYFRAPQVHLPVQGGAGAAVTVAACVVVVVLIGIMPGHWLGFSADAEQGLHASQIEQPIDNAGNRLTKSTLDKDEAARLE